MLFLCHWRGDYDESASSIYEHLCEIFGRDAVFDGTAPAAAGSGFPYDVDDRIRHSEALVVLITPDWLEAIAPASGRRDDDAMFLALESALKVGKPVFPVLVNGATMPGMEQLPATIQGIAKRSFLEIPAGRASAEGMRTLVASVEQLRRDRAVRGPPDIPVPASIPEPAGSPAFRAPPQPRPSPSYSAPSTMRGDVEEERYGSGPLPRRARSGVFGSLLTGLRTLWTPKSAEPRAEPVLLAASAPRSSSLGAEFTAALVAYVEAARASAHKKLADLGEPDDRRVEDIAASAWRVGAPVTVRLMGEGATVTPPEVRFDWSGRENLAAFSVKVGSTPRDAVLLSFHILVADVPVAFVPMRVALAAATASGSTHRVEAALPGSAFASYSSRDAEPVTQRLSTLSRWAPGLDIFQDCLDLTPGETFKPQLESQIARRDVFILFWSRQAALSPWVRWEYTTALQCKGLGAILPMPLEDPAIAPPPPELADKHQRDRFMLAGYGLAKVREEAGRNGATPT
jgi:hypothetical protein